MTILETRGLSRNFGGVQAVRSVDFSLSKGEVRAVIGPNGAGKTTFVSMISGRIRPSEGQVIFAGRDITARAPWRRVNEGIVYTFQITSVFQDLSCYDNVALAVQRLSMRGIRGRCWQNQDFLEGRVMAALARVGLDGDGERLASALPYGHQRLLETAMGLALSPKLLILDEPTQGLAEAEIENFCTLIKALPGEITVLLIEHNMPVVMELVDRITVLDQGSVLAEGTASDIAANADVQKAYLGT